MCGIVGHIATGSPVSAERMERARDLLVHRGPDDAGRWTDGTAHLGFRRLAILDLSAAGHQPMVTPDGRLAVVFNGEIYNHRALRAELEGRFTFRSETDTEVLLHGFRAWGWEGLLARIDGMFAFALWDADARRLYAARDRLGKKPLYYAETAHGLAFASSLHALRALVPEASSALDLDAVDAFLTYQAVPAPRTLFRACRQLEPAHALVYDARPAAGGDRLATRRYWDVAFAPKRRASEAEVLDDLDGLVRAAVARRLESDVPLGAFLSGGVDSSLVVALMAQAQDAPVEAVVMGFDDPAFDERPYARLVAQRWGARLHEHVLRPDAVADLPEIVWQHGQPVADVSIVPTYYVARAAREHVTVVLNGDGGDEVFGGYARPVVARAAQAYRRAFPAPVRRAVRERLGPVNGHAGLQKHLRMLAEAGATSAADAFVYDRAFRPHRRDAYGAALRAHLAAGPGADAYYRATWAHAVGADDVDRALYGDLTTYLPDQLLPKMDTATMAHSLEARSPLLDTRLIEYAATIPTALRLRGFRTKHLLKRLAERYVPREVLYRRKRGFVMPAADWMRGELAPYVRAALLSEPFRDRGWIEPAFAERMVAEHTAGARNWGEQVWTLFVLELWARLTLDGTLQRGDSLDALL